MLPLIDLDHVALVEVVRTDWNLWRAAAPDEVFGTVLATITGDAAVDLVGLVDRLPNGERARCFLPRYGLRIWHENCDLTDVVLCFSCNVAVFRRGSQSCDIFFDGSDSLSQELLAELRSFDTTADRPSGP